MTDSRSTLEHRATARIPGGVNSPVRAFRSVGGAPLFAARAEGPYLFDTDGNRYIDFCLSFGPLMLGHAHPEVVEAVRDAAGRGTSFAVTTEVEVEMAELLTDAVDAMDMVRLVNSGTEAVMTALRLARGITGRSHVVKFTGCYHGHVDSMLVKAGSGVAGMAESGSAGVTEAAAHQTLLAPYNDFEAVASLMKERGGEVAAIVVEPAAANMGLVLPAPEFLKHLEALCRAHGALLIFDEVITGFRTQYGAWSNHCCATPDLTCLGKIIGGGLPIGAVGGSRACMRHLAPEGPVYQAGTLSGNPVSVACGLATLRHLRDHDPYPELARRTIGFVEGLLADAREAGIALAAPREGSLYSLFFRDGAPGNFDEVQESDADRFNRVFRHLLAGGVYVAPSAFEAGFLSMAHDDAVLEQARSVFRQAFQAEAKR